MQKDGKDRYANLHKKVVDFYNCIHAYKDEGEGGKWRRVESGFLRFCGKGITSFSYISVEG
jgi:hypothetical protein